MNDQSSEPPKERGTRLLRVAEHVREQNWTAIGIDFLTVMIGVFVGVQVSTRNEERVDRERGTEFTERLGLSGFRVNFRGRHSTG